MPGTAYSVQARLTTDQNTLSGVNQIANFAPLDLNWTGVNHDEGVPFPLHIHDQIGEEAGYPSSQWIAVRRLIFDD